MFNFTRNFTLFAGMACAVVIVGCGEKDLSAVNPKWDRDVCEHCKMAVSDPHFSAQVVTKAGEHLFFDDLGCALIWMSRNEKRAQGSVLYATDALSGKWVERKDAIFVTPYVTPMSYGIGVLSKGSSVPEGKQVLTDDQMQENILKTFRKKQESRAGGHVHNH